MKCKGVVVTVLLAMSLSIGVQRMLGQAQVTGDIQGVVTDPSKAVLNNATVMLTSNATGAVRRAKTTSSGQYQFNLLPPGSYIVSVKAAGFQAMQRSVVVEVGQITPVNLQMSLATASQSVEVAGAEAPLLQTENGNVSSTLSEQQVKEEPIPGGDLNYLAQLAPGAEMVGSSAFPSVFGMPTNSNLYTLNGMEDVDPWNNSTNGGASNLLLGGNAVQESTVVSNGYSAQYGTLAGSNVNIVTKSGSNQFHGNLADSWAGSDLEANDFFLNKDGDPRSFTNADQWAGSIGGPILKNKLFFFVDDEGLTLDLPGGETPVLVPTTAFENATITNLTNLGLTKSIPFYQTMFKLYNAAPGASTAAPAPLQAGETGGGCGAFTGLAAGTACTNEFYSPATNTSWENIFTGRIDYDLGANDHASYNFLLDRGVQDTGVDPINSAFNAISHQPEFNMQLSETHTFGSSAVNQVQFAGQNYKATFEPANLATALSTFPTTLELGDGTLTNLGGSDYDYPQGRNVTRYQASDDYSRLWGNHSFQTGVYFSRYDANDKQFGEYTSGLLEPTDLAAFYNGGYDSTPGDVTTYEQDYPVALEQPLAMYRLGVYAQDEWHLTSNLSITLALRLDHPSNPVCQDNCFADTGAFLLIPHDAATPYNQTIQTGLATGLPGLQGIEWQPRFGFAWTPAEFSGRTVVRGGFGMFSDNFPMDTITGFATNPPEDPSFTASGDYLAPSEATNVEQDAENDYQALKTGFAAGDTLAQLQAAVPGFKPPNLTTSDANVLNPTYYKWDLEVQQTLWTNASLDVSYNGNRGIHELIENGGVNAYDPAGFTGLPTAPLDPRFLTVTDYESDGISNYNGLLATLNDHFSTGVLQISYTWSHALDDGFGSGSTRTIQDPFDPMASYGPSDFDMRQYVQAQYVWNVPFNKWFGGPKALSAGWEFTGVLIAHTGLPFYVYNSTSLGADGYLGATGSGGRVLSNYLGGGEASCSSPSTPCLLAAEFSDATTGFSSQPRNDFRGPGFWNTNMTLAKNFAIPGWESGTLQFAATGYNVFNHPNFALPGENLGTGSTFGQLTSMQDTASSPLGDNGADDAPRIVQLRLELIF